ncbi:hypothetical protein [Parasitella parasitica]|uniref:NDT80 domain-containing protein n=1 Tax=Parasitella parasitica TaxID=35722 RepID=A0A0B7NFL0_9FUNG|nr:hypothetical protein [Parasitella parasitica]
MNPTNESKDWHQATALHHPMNDASDMPQSPQLQQYSPMPAMDHHSYGQSFPQGPIHPPVHHHQLLPQSSCLAIGKSDSGSRLPGMMALSQPGTPRPSHHTSPVSKKAHPDYTTSSFHAAPYAHPALARKKGRSELFSTELSPFFSSTKPVDNLYALDRSTLLTIRIQAKMDRGFFLADNDWTCYRRNYFQVSGAFGIHGLNHYYADQDTQCLVQVDGAFYPVRNFSMNISARVSNSDKKIDLVQHTPKRDKGPQSTPTARLIIPGGNLSMSSVGANQSIVTFERIQFKTATANNGKRRAAQQYYVCLVDLYAEIEGDKKIKIASCQSAPLVVRGRSPGHYSDNHDRYENTGNSIPMGTVNPLPPSQHQNHQSDRYNNAPAPAGPFPRPPMTPPGILGSDYGSPYPYQAYSTSYSHFSSGQGPMHGGIMPPTPTGQHPSHHHPHHSQQQHNSSSYMIPSMTSDPSSSETSSPDLYNGEFGRGNNGAAPAPNVGNNVLHEEVNRMNQLPHLPHPHHGMNSMHMPAMDGNDWRGRIPSGHHSPAIAYEHHPNSYFSQSPTNNNGPSAFSNHSAPSAPYGGPAHVAPAPTNGPRKYTSNSTIIQQQAS